MKRKIYVASSWRNGYYPEVVAKLREAGHDVYDFRNPPSGDPGFKWGNVDPRFMEWSPEEYRDHLMHPKAVKQFKNDIEAMEACDTCVLCWAWKVDDSLYPRETGAGTDVQAVQ